MILVSDIQFINRQDCFIGTNQFEKFLASDLPEFSSFNLEIKTNDSDANDKTAVKC